MMKLIFITYNFSIGDVNIFFYNINQTLQSLTLTKSYMRTEKKQRDYLNMDGVE